MPDVQDEIDLLHIEIDKANAVVAQALRDRRALDKDSPLVANCNAAVTAARKALIVVEFELRKLYESKND